MPGQGQEARVPTNAGRSQIPRAILALALRSSIERHFPLVPFIWSGRTRVPSQGLLPIPGGRAGDPREAPGGQEAAQGPALRGTSSCSCFPGRAEGEGKLPAPAPAAGPGAAQPKRRPRLARRRGRADGGRGRPRSEFEPQPPLPRLPERSGGGGGGRGEGPAVRGGRGGGGRCLVAMGTAQLFPTPGPCQWRAARVRGYCRTAAICCGRGRNNAPLLERGPRGQEVPADRRGRPPRGEPLAGAPSCTCCPRRRPRQTKRAFLSAFLGTPPSLADPLIPVPPAVFFAPFFPPLSAASWSAVFCACHLKFGLPSKAVLTRTPSGPSPSLSLW